jgi:glutaredoxin
VCTSTQKKTEMESVIGQPCLVLVVKPGCGFCKKALVFLQESGMHAYLLNPPEKSHHLIHQAAERVGVHIPKSHNTFPYVFYKKNFVGGLRELSAYVAENGNEDWNAHLPIYVSGDKALMEVHKNPTAHLYLM